MNMYYEMHLQYEGKDKPNWLEKFVVNKCWMDWRSPYVECFNEHIDEWNKEWDELYPGLEIGDIDSENGKMYGAFLKKKAEPYFRAIKTPMINIEVNDGSAGEGPGDLIGRFKDGRDCVIRMYLKEVEV